MGEQGPAEQIPEWFTRYVREQQSQVATAQENERLMAEERRRKEKEDRALKVRNDNKPGKALPALLEYYGDADKLESWLQQAKAKVEVDYYGCTDFVSFWALNGALRGKALRRMEAWVREQGTPEHASAQAFLDRVEFIFKDPHAKERAQRKLEALRQGTKPFLEVFTEWQSLLLESGGSSWPDDAKKLSLDRILSDELVRTMITVPSQPDFENYCSILKETDDRLRAYKTRSGTRNNPIPATPTKSSWRKVTDVTSLITDGKDSYKGKATRRASTESMEWEPTSVKALATSTKRAKRVSQGELDDRRKTGRCLRCGSSGPSSGPQGHLIRDCPYLPPRPHVNTNTVRKGKEKEKEKERGPELEDSEDSSESEN